MVRCLPYVAVLPLVGCLGFLGPSDDDSSQVTATLQLGDPSPHDEGELQYSPIVQWDQFQFEGFPVFYYVPPNPIAIVHAFHGSNGSVGYCKKIETIATLNELIVDGFGFVCTESTDRGSGKWNHSDGVSDNPDLQRLLALHEHLIADTQITAATPVFSMGFSGGGSMSTFFADQVSIAGYDGRASAPHQSGGSAWGMDHIPIIWVISVNDPQPDAEESAADRIDQGLPTEIHHCPEQLIDDVWFTHDPGVGAGTAAKIHEAGIGSLRGASGPLGGRRSSDAPSARTEATSKSMASVSTEWASSPSGAGVSPGRRSTNSISRGGTRWLPERGGLST